MKIDKDKIVKTGEWLYDGVIPCQIIITREDMFPGTGDYEDPPKISEDKDIPCFQIHYEGPSRRGESNSGAGGGYALTLEDAIRDVESTIRSKVTWKT